MHAANDDDSLALTEATVHDYIRFFLYFVRGDEGAFALIESPSEIELAEGDVVAGHNGGSPEVDASELQARLANARSHARPLTAPVVGEDGRWVVEGTVAYGGGLFESTFAVAADGQIEMLDDNPVEELGGLATPEFPSLELEWPRPPYPPPLPPGYTGPVPLGYYPPAPTDGTAEEAAGEPQELELVRDRDVTQAIVGVLLEDAFQALDLEGAGANMLVRHFNSQAAGDTPLALLTRLVAGSMPVIVIESDIPFVEDFVAGLVDGPNRAISGGLISRAIAADEMRCSIDPTTTAKLHLLSFHAYRGLHDAERTAHELAIGDCAVLIGCAREADVPEPLRRIADLTLTFPRIDRRRFVRIFERVFRAKPTPGWDAPGADWTQYLVPSDFHHPRRLGTSPDEALLFLKDRVETRLAALTPDIGPKLKELHGLGEARQICEDIVTDIHAAQAGRIPWSAVDKGVLMVGAPGTGKTTLARALAKECGIKFIPTTATSWQSAGHLGAHLAAMRTDFNEARRYAPAILFIDEIDSVGSRQLLVGDQHSVYQTDVINALLAEIQGIDTDDQVVVIGATNYEERVDPALRRAGRLDQVVQLPFPNVEALEHIFDYYLAPHRAAKQVARGVELAPSPSSRGAVRAPTWSSSCAAPPGAPGARGGRSSRRISSRRSPAGLAAPTASRCGERRSCGAPPSTRAATPSLASSARRKGEDLTFVTIVPRLDGSLGFVATAPREGHQYTRRTLLEQLETVLAGRAAEELVYGADDIGAGAGGPSESSDLAVGTRLAELIVCQTGLGEDNALHWTAVPTPAQVKQIGALLTKSYRSILDRLEANRDLLDRIVEVLEEKQELSGPELRKLLERAGGAELSRPESG